nr:receptor-like protein 12 [Ipomoea batatas]
MQPLTAASGMAFTCSSEGRVVGLDLSSESISGETILVALFQNLNFQTDVQLLNNILSRNIVGRSDCQSPLVNCRFLEVLNMLEHKIADRFPMPFEELIPHWHVHKSCTPIVSFGDLHLFLFQSELENIFIIDISSNKFVVLDKDSFRDKSLDFADVHECNVPHSLQVPSGFAGLSSSGSHSGSKNEQNIGGIENSRQSFKSSVSESLSLLSSSFNSSPIPVQIPSGNIKADKLVTLDLFNQFTVLVSHKTRDPILKPFFENKIELKKFNLDRVNSQLKCSFQNFPANFTNFTSLISVGSVSSGRISKSILQLKLYINLTSTQSGSYGGFQNSNRMILRDRSA